MKNIRQMENKITRRKRNVTRLGNRKRCTITNNNLVGRGNRGNIRMGMSHMIGSSEVKVPIRISRLSDMQAIKGAGQIRSLGTLSNNMTKLLTIPASTRSTRVWCRA